jgi:hypothetical protein
LRTRAEGGGPDEALAGFASVEVLLHLGARRGRELALHEGDDLSVEEAAGRDGAPDVPVHRTVARRVLMV